MFNEDIQLTKSKFKVEMVAKESGVFCLLFVTLGAFAAECIEKDYDKEKFDYNLKSCHGRY